MEEYTVVNILDMLEAIGEENLSAILSDFFVRLIKKLKILYGIMRLNLQKRKCPLHISLWMQRARLQQSLL